MGNANLICEFEGDDTQKLSNMVWEKEYLFPKKIRLSAGRVIFTPGDLADYQALVEAYETVVTANLLKLASFNLGAIGGAAGGFPIGSYPLAGDNLEELPAAPTYSGDKELVLKIYSEDVLRVTIPLYHNEIFKFNAGSKKRKWKYRIEGNVDQVTLVDLATSVDEIKRDNVEV